MHRICFITVLSVDFIEMPSRKAATIYLRTHSFGLMIDWNDLACHQFNRWWYSSFEKGSWSHSTKSVFIQSKYREYRRGFFVHQFFLWLLIICICARFILWDWNPVTNKWIIPLNRDRKKRNCSNIDSCNMKSHI